MTKNLLIVVLFILSHNYIMGQKNVNLVLVSGKIIEIETNLPLEYATITFFSKVENNLTR